MSWNDELKTKLEKLVADGKSQSEIATILSKNPNCKFTREAIGAKIWRDKTRQKAQVKLTHKYRPRFGIDISISKSISKVA